MKTELVERLKAALEDESEKQVEALDAEAEADSERPDFVPAGGAEDEKQASGIEDGEPSENTLNDQIRSAMSDEDATVKESEVDLEDNGGDKGDKIERNNDLEIEKLAEEEDPAIQTTPIGLRELRFVSKCMP